MSVPGEFVAGDVLAASEMNALGGAHRGYAEITANQAGITTLADITGLSVTTPTLPAGRRVKVTVYTHALTSSVAGDRGNAVIREGSTVLQGMLHDFRTNDTRDGVIVIWIGTPSSGAHTYKASYERTAGSGSHTWHGAADTPSFILVEDIGPA